MQFMQSAEEQVDLGADLVRRQSGDRFGMVAIGHGGAALAAYLLGVGALVAVVSVGLHDVLDETDVAFACLCPWLVFAEVEFPLNFGITFFTEATHVSTVLHQNMVVIVLKFETLEILMFLSLM